MADAYTTLVRLLRTEKGTNLLNNRQYCFTVARKANKVEIKKAVEEVYKVKVTAVNTMVAPGKKRRVRFEEGKKPDWKKAIVTLKEGDKIELT